MNLRRSLLRLNGIVTLDSTHATDRFGLFVVRRRLIVPGFVFGLGFRRDFVFEFLGLGGTFDSGLMNLGRSFLRLNGVLTLDSTHTTDRLGLIVVRRRLIVPGLRFCGDLIR